MRRIWCTAVRAGRSCMVSRTKWWVRSQSFCCTNTSVWPERLVVESNIAAYSEKIKLSKIEQTRAVATPFHDWPPVAAYIQCCILKKWPLFCVWPPLLRNPGDGPGTNPFFPSYTTHVARALWRSIESSSFVSTAARILASRFRIQRFWAMPHETVNRFMNSSQTHRYKRFIVFRSLLWFMFLFKLGWSFRWRLPCWNIEKYFAEVRSAAVDSLTELASQRSNPSFAQVKPPARTRFCECSRHVIQIEHVCF